MSHLFISHANADGADLARQLAAALEAISRPCWIAPRDLLPDLPLPGQIVRAIQGSRGMVLLLTPGANQSQDVLMEVERAHTGNKIIAAVIVDGTEPSDNLIFFVGARHRIHCTDARAVAATLGVLFERTEAGPAAGDRRTQEHSQTTEAPMSSEEVSQRANDLISSALGKGRRGAIIDYSAVIGQRGAPAEVVAVALLQRGTGRGLQGDIGGEFADYSAVIGLAGAPVDLVAKALPNRGIAGGLQGDSAGEITPRRSGCRERLRIWWPRRW